MCRFAELAESFPTEVGCERTRKSSDNGNPSKLGEGMKVWPCAVGLDGVDAMMA
jgi:hypothetical protein